jgi:glutamate-5-semialdehyde dehydrogenase
MTHAATLPQNISDNSSVSELMHALGLRAKQAYRVLAIATEAQKNTALMQAAKVLDARTDEIIAANQQDMAAGQEKGLSSAMLDRLKLDAARIHAIAEGVRAIAQLPDPVGTILEDYTRDENGLHIQRVSVPLGVIGIIYESRPNVTADAGALCIKSGNTAILRGGSESFHSSAAIVACMHEGLHLAGLPVDAVQLVPTRDRAAVGEMLTMTDTIDIIVPRGGKSLTARIAAESRIPTIQHLDGNCHIYVHHAADAAKALRVIHNAKLRRTGVCGAAESLVIDAAIVGSILPKIIDALHGCEVRGDAAAQAIDARVLPATDEDWGQEYLDAVISVKVVQNEAEAIAHVNHFSSHHTDAIITEDAKSAARFHQEVDSAIVMHNTSTQFADGGEFGMGAEIGISTGRLHARGPVGCKQLTTYKYVVRSDGAVRG